MITEDYVSFETAKLLKEKGFEGYSILTIYDENAANAYIKELQEKHLPYSSDDPKLKEFYYTQPTIQMAMKWLREVYHWHIFVFPRWEDVEYMPGEWEEQMVGYQYTIINVGEFNVKYEQPITTALSSESACEAAIKYCLENLI